jgi:hypothetical protein
MWCDFILSNGAYREYGLLIATIIQTHTHTNTYALDWRGKRGVAARMGGEI